MPVPQNYLFLLGAPKCGTSSLFTWLATHPEVQGSNPKETHYFLDPGHPLIQGQAHFSQSGWEGFTTCFPSKNSHISWRLESSTHQLYSSLALKEIPRHNPTPHIIVLLRQPSDRIWSSFQYTRNNLGRLNSKLSFSHYVNCLLNGRNEELRPWFTDERSFYVLSRDHHYSRYWDYLKLWKERLPEENIHVFLLEDLKADPEKVTKKIFKRIGASDEGFGDFNFEKTNTTQAIRFPVIQGLVRKVFGDQAKSFPFRKQIKDAYLLFQSSGHLQQKENPSTEDREALKRLDGWFVKPNRELSRNMGLNLEAWNK